MEPNWAEQVVAWCALGGTAAAVLAAVFTGLQLKSSRQQTKDSLRPVLTFSVDRRQVTESDAIVFVDLRNIGPGPAVDVVVMCIALTDSKRDVTSTKLVASIPAGEKTKISLDLPITWNTKVALRHGYKDIYGRNFGDPHGDFQADPATDFGAFKGQTLFSRLMRGIRGK